MVDFSAVGGESGDAVDVRASEGHCGLICCVRGGSRVLDGGDAGTKALVAARRTAEAYCTQEEESTITDGDLMIEKTTRCIVKIKNEDCTRRYGAV